MLSVYENIYILEEEINSDNLMTHCVQCVQIHCVFVYYIGLVTILINNQV